MSMLLDQIDQNHKGDNFNSSQTEVIYSGDDTGSGQDLDPFYSIEIVGFTSFSNWEPNKPN